jgi:hypothetical protein
MLVQNVKGSARYRALAIFIHNIYSFRCVNFGIIPIPKEKIYATLRFFPILTFVTYAFHVYRGSHHFEVMNRLGRSLQVIELPRGKIETVSREIWGYSRETCR